MIDYVKYLEQANLKKQKAEQKLSGTAVRGDGKLLFNGYRAYVGNVFKLWGIDNSDGYITL